MMSDSEQQLAMRYLQQMVRSGVCSTCPLHEFNHIGVSEDGIARHGIDSERYLEDLEGLAVWAAHNDVLTAAYEEDAPHRVERDPEGRD